MKFEVETNKNSFEKAAKLLAGIPNGVETAMSRAFNRALQEGRTAGTREVTKQYTVKAKDVRSTFAMKRASKSNLEAELSSKGQRLPLSSFAHRPSTDTTGARRQQVRVGVKKGGLKPLGQAFVHNGRILQRLGSTSYPVQQKFGAAVPSMLNNDDVVDVVVETMNKSVDKRLEHEAGRILEGAVK